MSYQASNREEDAHNPNISEDDGSSDEASSEDSDLDDDELEEIEKMMR